MNTADLVICNPVPICVIVNPLPVVAVALPVKPFLISPRILSAVIVVSVSNGVGCGLTKAKLA